MTYKSPGCHGKCEQGRTRCPSPEVCFKPREAKDSALDSLITLIDFADTKDYEKGSIFPNGSSASVVKGLVLAAIIGAALAYALTSGSVTP